MLLTSDLISSPVLAVLAIAERSGEVLLSDTGWREIFNRLPSNSPCCSISLRGMPMIVFRSMLSELLRILRQLRSCCMTQALNIIVSTGLWLLSLPKIPSPESADSLSLIHI